MSSICKAECLFPECTFCLYISVAVLDKNNCSLDIDWNEQGLYPLRKCLCMTWYLWSVATVMKMYIWQVYDMNFKAVLHKYCLGGFLHLGPELTLPNLETTALTERCRNEGSGCFSWVLAWYLMMGSVLCFLNLSVLMDKWELENTVNVCIGSNVNVSAFHYVSRYLLNLLSHSYFLFLWASFQWRVLLTCSPIVL